MRTIAIINLKGGVAKTTSSINIAYILTQRGYKVLLVDNDKQGDCSRGLNRRTQDGEGIDRIMVDRHPDMYKLIHHTDYVNLDIITANLGLLTANMEVTMDRVRPQQNRLKKALQQVSDRYDFCVVDNAPDINISVINALTAANDVLVPVEVDDNTLEGMNELLDQIDEVQEELNPDLENVRCFVTKYQKFNQAHLQGAEVIKEQYPAMETKIRFSGDQWNILRSCVAVRIYPRLYDLVSIQFASRRIPFALHTGCGGNVYHRRQAAVYHNEKALCCVE